jgi:hypothetical protein
MALRGSSMWLDIHQKLGKNFLLVLLASEGQYKLQINLIIFLTDLITGT